MGLVSAFLEILKKPSVGDMVAELMVFVAPIWIAVVVGVMLGWAWKPKWANLKDSSFSSSPSFSSIKSSFVSIPIVPSTSWIPILGLDRDNSAASSRTSLDFSLESRVDVDKRDKSSVVVNEDDLKHLHNLVEEKDGGPSWIQMMDKSTPNMSYQAWRRDPQTGPPQYRSRTIYEDATPEMVRDFFWDDEFRLKWDDMLIHAQTLEECPSTGTMVVQWVRKFPFFCSDREYIIGRRIWESGSTYYCITKGVPCSTVPRRSKPRRVDLYYSSWCIRPAESMRDGRQTACEVLLFHHEDMGIPWEIAKLGVRQGMWGAVKKIDPGLRAYQKHRASGAPLSRSAELAQINTKVCVKTLESMGTSTISGSQEIESYVSADKAQRRGIPKALVVGGAIALACTLDRGLITKAVIFGVARRFANIGGRRL